MIILALLLILLGLAFAKVLFTIGVILLIVGIVINIVPFGGRRGRWY